MIFVAFVANSPVYLMISPAKQTGLPSRFLAYVNMTVSRMVWSFGAQAAGADMVRQWNVTASDILTSRTHAHPMICGVTDRTVAGLLDTGCVGRWNSELAGRRLFLEFWGPA
ncbi:MAG: hypothetical protein NZ842_08625 [Dehalococcoidia bacterium]|nr:hypothetical protein [Dehalococcoidia bacterium]